MQLFPCPFCGLRNEREFHFDGEAGKIRPDTTQAIPDEDWATYLYTQRNDFGAAREIWTHATCREMFVMERDTRTMQVLSVTPLRKGVM